ncbi:MAG: hypothetical protein KKF62_08105, partial [Bacteroidetes bacterium]|nr:hypothetical protein [Bacteroidota bacterium]
IILAIKFTCNGFSFSQLFSSWWQVVVLFLELIPGIDVLPWYVLSVLKIKPKKKIPKVEIKK